MKKFTIRAVIKVIFLLWSLEHCLAFPPVINPKTSYKDRTSKWLPFIVIIGNEPCASSDSHEIGSCFTRSVGFPDSFIPKGSQDCSTKIMKPENGVCQALLIFHDMELNKGDEHGHCLVDRIHLFGMVNQEIPHLCGPLSKQHLYLEFGRGNQITLSILTKGSKINNRRKWNVQVIYIHCDDPFRAPAGCLQYYTNSTGKVKILGYPESPHLAGLQYTICVRREEAAESIFWFPCRDVPFEKTFHFQGPNFLTTFFSVHWISCYGDYIVIMTDRTSTAMPNIPKDRFCGNRLTAFPPFYINSKATPYIIVVRTDFGESTDEIDNPGFCLEWYQVIWKPKDNTGVMSGAMPPPILPPTGP